MKAINNENANIILSKDNILSKINVKAGDLTFGQRIEIGKIYSDTSKSELDKFEAIFIALHKYKPKAKEYSKLIDYFIEIITGLEFWVNQENILLKYEPTEKEKRAGIKQLTLDTGELGTIKALAKNYSQDPDTILIWKYGKVFGILYSDLKEYLYQTKYHSLK